MSLQNVPSTCLRNQSGVPTPEQQHIYLSNIIAVARAYESWYLRRAQLLPAARVTKRIPSMGAIGRINIGCQLKALLL